MSLAELGLRVGEVVRWRPKDGAHWRQGRITGRERDGSIGVRDPQGRARAFPLDRLEVRATGPRGATTWEPAVDRAARTEQLGLFP